MAKPKPIVEPPIPKIRVYETLKVLVDVMTNEHTPIGSFIELPEDEAEKFLKSGAIRLTNRKPEKPKKEGK